jgi:hypothetical protein
MDYNQHYQSEDSVDRDGYRRALYLDAGYQWSNAWNRDIAHHIALDYHPGVQQQPIKDENASASDIQAEQELERNAGITGEDDRDSDYRRAHHENQVFQADVKKVLKSPSGRVEEQV